MVTMVDVDIEPGYRPSNAGNRMDMRYGAQTPVISTSPDKIDIKDRSRERQVRSPML